MAESERRPEKKRLKLIEQLRNLGVAFFLDTDLEPTVNIPEDNYQQEWSVSSERFNDFLITLYFEQNGKLPATQEVTLLMSLIREECRHGGRRLSQPQETVTDEDCIVQGVTCLMNKQKVFNGKTAVLLNELLKYQTDGKISQVDPIPVFTNMFSRRLKRLGPVLVGYGLKVTQRHEEDGSYTVIERTSQFKEEEEAGSKSEPTHDVIHKSPSENSSDVTSTPGKDFRQADATDGNIRFEESAPKVANEVNLNGGAQ